MSNKNLLENVLEGIYTESKSNRDFEINFNDLRMCDEGRIFSIDKSDKKGSILSDFAATQLFTKTDMPVRYMKRLLEESPDLVAKQFNYWAEKQKAEKRLLIRGKITNEGFNVRGVLSDKYTILDNRDLIESLIEVSDNVPDFKIESVINTDKKFHMRVSFPGIYSDFGTSVEGLNDIIRVGLDIQNSEVGYSSLMISPITYRLVCTNGLKVWRKEEGAYSFRHVHMSRGDLISAVNNSIGLSIDRGKEMIEGMKNSRNLKVENPYELIDQIIGEHDLPAKLSVKVKESFDIEPENNMFGVLNSFTRTARDLPNHDSRLKVESLASELMLV